MSYLILLLLPNWIFYAVNEFTVMIGRDIHSEIIANGRPSPAKIRNAMSNPITFKALQDVGLIPAEVQRIEGNVSPSLVCIKPLEEIMCLE